jgi:glyoxylase-like metal-dependent hydrolase (beta-lactamase superfamily II)
VHEVAPGLEVLDTRLGGWEGITAAYLMRGARPALIETGARTSAETVAGALADAGLGPDDLAFIVLTHIHLDHCGGTGLLAERFPRAEVVVHRRGARHLVDPARLVAASAEVYGELAPLYGGLDPVPAERVVAAEDGHRIELGDGRALVMVETLGHARHHMSVLEEGSGTVLAGDALGVMFAGAGLYQALPPPDVDLERADASLRRLADLAPTQLCLGHFGPVPDPAQALDDARAQVARVGEAAISGWRNGASVAAVAAAVEAALPLEATVREPAALERWRMLRWGANNAAGLARWAAAQDDHVNLT